MHLHFSTCTNYSACCLNCVQVEMVISVAQWLAGASLEQVSQCCGLQILLPLQCLALVYAGGDSPLLRKDSLLHLVDRSSVAMANCVAVANGVACLTSVCRWRWFAVAQGLAAALG
jgi:hypothetical protein